MSLSTAIRTINSSVDTLAPLVPLTWPDRTLRGLLPATDVMSSGSASTIRGDELFNRGDPFSDTTGDSLAFIDFGTCSPARLSRAGSTSGRQLDSLGGGLGQQCQGDTTRLRIADGIGQDGEPFFHARGAPVRHLLTHLEPMTPCGLGVVVGAGRSRKPARSIPATGTVRWYRETPVRHAR